MVPYEFNTSAGTACVNILGKVRHKCGEALWGENKFGISIAIVRRFHFLYTSLINFLPPPLKSIEVFRKKNFRGGGVLFFAFYPKLKKST